jgi:hypothetical protein
MLFGCFAISLGPLFWLAISQIYPLGVRGLAMGIATMTNGGFKLLVVLTFPLLVEALGALRLSGFIGRRASRPWCSGTALFRGVSSRQGCESCEVEVLVPPIACSRADSISDACEGNDARSARM